MKALKIALLGYGKMGKEIEQIALSRSHEIIAKIDHQQDWIQQKEQLKAAHIAIDFSMPQVVKQNMLNCLEMGLPVIVGTTGWQQELQKITSLVQEKKGALLWASNFSLGVNLAFKINEFTAQLLSNFPEYQARIHEIHHTQKLDAPSGTAISLAKDLIQNHQTYNKWTLLKKNENISEEILPITYERIKDVPGTHQITYQSDIDQISISHKAFSRKGFALGAVVAAEWLGEKKGVFTMADVLG